MVDHERVREKLQIIRTAATRLTALSRLSHRAFLAGPDNFAIAEHHVRRALEAVFDTARHITVKLGWGHPATHRDTVGFLAQHGILEATFAATLQRMAGYRNRLVHEYDTVTAEEMFELLQMRLGDLETYGVAIEAFLSQLAAEPTHCDAEPPAR